jgi:hypothetical protein
MECQSVGLLRELGLPINRGNASSAQLGGTIHCMALGIGQVCKRILGGHCKPQLGSQTRGLVHWLTQLLVVT